MALQMKTADREYLVSLSPNTLREQFKAYMHERGYAPNSITMMASDCFYLWRNAGQDSFWNVVFSDQFEDDAASKLIAVFEAQGKDTKSVNGYLRPLKIFREFLIEKHNGDVDSKEVEFTKDSSTDSNASEKGPSATVGDQRVSDYEFESGITLYSDDIDVSTDINAVFAYALYQNRVPIVRNVAVRNKSENPLEKLTIRIETDVPLLEPYEGRIDLVPGNEERFLKNPRIKVNVKLLASITERFTCTVKVSVYKGDILLATASSNMIVLAYSEWPGLRYNPDLLAAFVQPNHPMVKSLLKSASNWLKKWKKSPSLEGYQKKDANRVLEQAAAAYAAIQELDISYANPPASFEDIGQRIRMPDEIKEFRLGTCMDMTLLYAACLEAMGLNSLLILIKGHIFAGLWLKEDTFPDSYMDDPSQLEKRLADGINEIAVVECTAMCSGKKVTFDEANIAGEDRVSDFENFNGVVDLCRARRSGVRPIPIRIKEGNDYKVESDKRPEEEITDAPEEIDVVDIKTKTTPATKQTQWERKLLDLSMRNMLINLRLTRSILPILTADVYGLEDALSNGEEFEILPRPSEWDTHNITVGTTETVADLGSYAELIALDESHHRLHSWQTEKEVERLMNKLYREARTSMEENGVSTLYLTVGCLRWVSGVRKGAEHFAPIILIPIEIIRKSAQKGFVIKKNDDDAQVNVTLLEFLKQEYGIEIGGLTPPPHDDHGIDVRKVFAIIRKAVMKQSKWDIVETSHIGHFSFTQFLMWNDIHSRSDLLEKNKIVHSLITGGITWDTTIPEEVETDIPYLPVQVDESQLRAINMAANDVSFVLHGPPGTGKSQTITALIANALTKGKTVLFVAEKMAALEVVHKRLKALGIEDFCLELHSNKAVKRNILNQLNKSLNKRGWGLKTEYKEKLEENLRMREELDDYAKALNRKRENGFTLRELIALYEGFSDDINTIILRGIDTIELTRDRIEECVSLVDQYMEAYDRVRDPESSPFSFVNETEYSQSFRLAVEEAVSDYRDSIDQFESNSLKMVQLFGRQNPATKADYSDLVDEIRSILSVSIQTESTDISLDDAFSRVMTYLKNKRDVDASTAQMNALWNDTAYQFDFSSVVQEYGLASKKIFGKAKAIEGVRSKVQYIAKFPLDLDKLSEYAASLLSYKTQLAAVQSELDALPEEWRAKIISNATEEELRSFYSLQKAQIDRESELRASLENASKNRPKEQIAEDLQQLIMSEAKMYDMEQHIQELLKADAIGEKSDWINEKRLLCDTIENDLAGLRYWMEYKKCLNRCRENRLEPIISSYKGDTGRGLILDVCRKSLYRIVIWSAIEQDAALDRFSGSDFERRVKEFKDVDDELSQIAKEEMYYVLTHKFTDLYDSLFISKELNTLQRAIQSGGRGMSIRMLFDQIPHVLVKASPCMLMSPISVAQYLSIDNDLFDIVVFDEASQLPTCKAVGVLARGKNAVIVGDPNQMPPTSFFAGNMIDEDNLDLEDLDSILDDCLALGMPQTHLQWHYRSRHESLIAFSNREYYENGMLTFPSINDRERKVRLVTVNGVFERKKGRVNRKEARAVVDEILRRYRNKKLKEMSIGVVTFNISQQGLIEDLLQEEYEKDADFDKWANEGEDPLFVKNLENVQGDERDVILFSIGFGRDEEGRISLNFGPLNREGGWKRLNVAVSRSRKEMLVFSSMTADMIDLSRTKAKGVEGLRDFLAFADSGKLQIEYSREERTNKDGILQRICEELSKAGYKYQRDVGNSDFKIDIAIVNPNHESEYMLGIMLDGTVYAKSKNTRDREISLVEVLRGLGWNIYRMWTMDWWDNRQNEIDKLLKKLDKIKSKAAKIKGDKDDGFPISEEIEGVNYQPRKVTRKKKDDDGEKNSSFDTYDRFRPHLPHQNSKDDLDAYIESRKQEDKTDNT